MLFVKPITRDRFELIKLNLAAKKALTIELVSNSMAPIMPTGTKAVIEPVEYDQIRPMDFVVSLANGMLVCHAAWEAGFFRSAAGERTLITRGLANPFFDEPIKESHILGRVTSHSISRGQFYWLALKTQFLLKLGIRPKDELKNNVRR